MKQENSKSPKKGNSVEKDDRWVDVHNDAVMRELGFSRIDVTPRDKSVWTKTPRERELLKKLRPTWNNLDMHFHRVPRKFIQVRAKLIIQLKKNNRFPKTTYSTTCWQHEIGDILLKYYWRNNKTGYSECLISKYVFNGKTYGPGERPFWQ